jgi:multiple sugar transport system substrate-binding protein
MTELWLTVYGDQPSPLQEPAFLLNQFEAQRHVAVRISHMPFEEAWPKLLNFALYGGGPHLSLIGAIWTSTLRSMNVLRPFSLPEVGSLGGANAFFPAAWDADTPGDSETWSIPINVFSYLLLYRKDRLAQAGIDANSAFATPQALTETVQRLKAASSAPALLLPHGKPFPARPHLLASWIWGAGGDFLSEDGRSARFIEPEAMRGMTDFFNLYRLHAPKEGGLSSAECMARFAAGETSLLLAGATAQQFIEQHNRPEVIENLGVAPLPGVPWIGGSNLVIWKEARLNSEVERSALDLAGFLTTPAAQVKLAAAQYSIPARAEALAQHTFTYPAFRAAVEHSMRFGRSYPRVKLWVRIMSELRSTFEAVTAEVIEKSEEDVPQILQRRLKPLAHRLSLMLS